MMIVESHSKELATRGVACATVGALLRPLLVLSSLIPLVGCNDGEELGLVSGQVTYDGKPVTAANVRFSDATQGIFLQARLDSDGRYKVATAAGEGLPLGSYQVAIAPYVNMPPVNVRLTSQEWKRRLNPTRADIPEKYRNENSSGLELEVSSGQNEFDIDLSD